MAKLTVNAIVIAAPTAALLALAGCDQKPPEPTPDKPAPQATQPAQKPASSSGETQPATEAQPGEIQWKKPDAWQEGTNPSAMRKATYKIPKAEGDAEDGELSVSAAGGDLTANIDRWKGQFEGSPEPKSSEKEVAGFKVTIVEIAGTFKGGGPMMGGGGEPKKDWIMLAAIVPTTPQMHFFKLTGPKKTVEAARADFDVLIGSITKK
jgi:hypothetical protein